MNEANMVQVAFKRVSNKDGVIGDQLQQLALDAGLGGGGGGELALCDAAECGEMIAHRVIGLHKLVEDDGAVSGDEGGASELKATGGGHHLAVERGDVRCVRERNATAAGLDAGEARRSGKLAVAEGGKGEIAVRELFGGKTVERGIFGPVGGVGGGRRVG
jgi:hypothetical protein